MDKKETPSWVHVFVCVNDRHGEKPSCADGDAVAIRTQLKAVSKKRGWWNQTVRVSQTGCLGLCQQGPNVLIHPKSAYFCRVTVDDVDLIVDELETAVSALLEEK